MNKGLFAHIASLVVYTIIVLFIIGGNETDFSDRLMIIVLLLLEQWWVWGLCEDFKFYDKKIKL